MGMSTGEAVDFYRDRMGYKYRSGLSLLLDDTVLGRLLQGGPADWSAASRAAIGDILVQFKVLGVVMWTTRCVYNQLAVQGLPQHYPCLECVHEEQVVDSRDCVALALLSSKQQPPMLLASEDEDFCKEIENVKFLTYFSVSRIVFAKITGLPAIVLVNGVLTVPIPDITLMEQLDIYKQNRITRERENGP